MSASAENPHPEPRGAERSLPIARRFVVVGRGASASGEFLLDDVPGTSGRLDVLLRCIRAALLTSHGIRRDVVLYLVLGGGPKAPRTVRITGASVRFLRPDERSLAVLLMKALSGREEEDEPGFVEFRAGIAVSRRDIECVLEDLGDSPCCLLDEGGQDVRQAGNFPFAKATIFLGDHAGFDESLRTRLLFMGASRFSLGPVSLHTDDAISIVSNEIDRRSSAPALEAARRKPSS